MSTLVRPASATRVLGPAPAIVRLLRAGQAPDEPRPRTVARTAVTALWLVAVLVEVAALTIWLARGGPRLPASFAGGPWAVMAISVCSLLTLSMGTFLARRLPGNLVGWVMIIPGLALLPVLPVSLMLHEALGVLRPVPDSTLVAAWLVSSVSAPIATGSLSVLLVLFPDGRPSSPRWAAALTVPILGTALLALGSALDRVVVWFPMLANPLDPGVMGAGLADVARITGFMGLVAAALIAAASLIDRYRDADAVLRRQIRWVVLGGTFTALTVAPLLIGRYLLRPGDAAGEVLVVVAALGAATFPIAVAVAITRADLFDIDLIIGRTLVYLPLTAILAGMYAALVTFLQRVFVALTGDTSDSDAVIVLTTLVIAAAFAPVRQTLDGFVERHFRVPRRARTPAAACVAGDAREVDPETLLELVVAQVERLEAVEARLLAVERSARRGRGPKLAKPAPRDRRAVASRG
jgi:hypothetical protein